MRERKRNRAIQLRFPGLDESETKRYTTMQPDGGLSVEVPKSRLKELLLRRRQELSTLMAARPDPLTQQQLARRAANEQFEEFKQQRVRLDKQTRYAYPIDRLDAKKLRRVPLYDETKQTLRF